MNVLSIQSNVAYGHVGNAAAVLPLQRLGHEVWAVDTVAFSNHPGHGGWRGRVFAAGEVANVIDGIAERGAFARCDAVLSGYLGDATIGATVLETVAAVKAANPGALYFCDPVMGDIDRGVFVRPGIPEFFREKALARADIICPNPFELEFLAGFEATSPDAALAAAHFLRALGAGLVVVTGLRRDAEIEVLAVGEEGSWRVRTPWLEVPSFGAGDAFSALFLGQYLATAEVGEALGRATSSMFGLMKATQAAGGRDLALVAAQDEFTSPSETFAAEKIG